MKMQLLVNLKNFCAVITIGLSCVNSANSDQQRFDGIPTLQTCLDDQELKSLSCLNQQRRPSLNSNIENMNEQFRMPKCQGFTLEEATIDQLQDAMKKGLLSSASLCLCYIDRYHQTKDLLKYAQDPRY